MSSRLTAKLSGVLHWHMDSDTIHLRDTVPRRVDAVRRDTTSYQEFLTLWKDAGPDIPILILKQAKAEYAKLR